MRVCALPGALTGCNPQTTCSSMRRAASAQARHTPYTCPLVAHTLSSGHRRGLVDRLCVCVCVCSETAFCHSTTRWARAAARGGRRGAPCRAITLDCRRGDDRRTASAYILEVHRGVPYHLPFAVRAQFKLVWGKVAKRRLSASSKDVQCCSCGRQRSHRQSKQLCSIQR